MIGCKILTGCIGRRRYGSGSGRNRWLRVENSKKRLSLRTAERVCDRSGVVCSGRRRQRKQLRTQTKVHSVSWFAASAHVTRFWSTWGGKLAEFWSVWDDVERTGYTCCQLVDHCLALPFLPAGCWRCCCCCWSELVLSPSRTRTTTCSLGSASAWR